MRIELVAGKKMFSTQMDDLKLLCQRPRFALFSEMGAGKSLPCAVLAKGVIEDDICDHVLIITPKAVLDDWRDIFKDFVYCDFKNLVTVYHAPKKVREFFQLRPIVIMTYETVVADVERFVQLAQSKRLMVVLDEAHRVRTTTSSRYKAIDSICRHATRVYLLTGTPLPNGLVNAFAYINLLAPGMYYQNLFHFKKLHVKTSPYSKRVIIGYRNEDRVTQILNSMSIRHLMEDVVDLPPVSNTTRYVEWDDAQRKAYMTLMEDGLLELEDRFIQAEGAFALLIRLHQILNHPEMLGIPCVSMKWQALHDDIEDIGIGTEGRKMVIWAHYRQTIDRLAEELKHLNPAKIYGGTADFEGQKRMFREDKDCHLMIANTMSVGVGTNFTVANYMAFFEYTFDLDNYDQAISRCRRPGQQHKLWVRNYAVKNSMESRKILPRLIAKKTFSKRILQDKDAFKDFIAMGVDMEDYF